MTIPTKRLFKQHNQLVKTMYKCTYDSFLTWFENYADENEQYIEIPGNECKSGHAEILDW